MVKMLLITSTPMCCAEVLLNGKTNKTNTIGIKFFFKIINFGTTKTLTVRKKWIQVLMNHTQ